MLTDEEYKDAQLSVESRCRQGTLVNELKPTPAGALE